MKRLKSKKGESLAETLAAMLVMVMAFMILPGAIVASARLENAVKQQALLAEEDRAVRLGSPLSVTVTPPAASGDTADTVSVEVYRYGNEGSGLYQYGAAELGE